MTSRNDSSRVSAPPSCASPGSEQARAFAAVNAAFGSLGRVCMALDGRFRVRYASEHLDRVVGPDAASRAPGQPIEALLGSELFGPEASGLRRR